MVLIAVIMLTVTLVCCSTFVVAVLYEEQARHSLDRLVSRFWGEEEE